MDILTSNQKKAGEPQIERSVTLNFQGDWGQANFHRICAWLTQEFCDRAGPESQVAIWSIRHGGVEAVPNVFHGRMQMAIATPAQLMTTALTGTGIFARYGPMPSLRALAVLPQNDRMVLAIHPKYGIGSFEELRAKKPSIRIATSCNDGTNFIGHVANAYLNCHGLSQEELASWGATFVTAHRPEQAVAKVISGEADVLLEEAVMTFFWEKVIDAMNFVPLPAEPSSLAKYAVDNPGAANPDSLPLPAGFWKSLAEPLPALDFADFVVLVRDDLPDDVAHLLTWCLVETKDNIECLYEDFPPNRSPLTVPLIPANMAKTPIPLHPGARRYYTEAGYL
ncbi:hypothetical protein BKA67DRAFT_537815 [Truncatella angustata]|uniref:Uncharacterized protein n=1 Tax=Truncatella angustata TaxID=152316 RepID=A0A9P8UH10_9PEZI|nr:uncharacterized protein BKA67DRAFT_537815 [Truncatella angustata]KAH6651965.1 hypothetical protein BKA67DRAFT_537815 [Truncatella angustata]KAH8205688.1 hypothetical protein TruAng_000182 [Truncatella angustata]